MAESLAFARTVFDPGASKQEKIVKELWVHNEEYCHDIAVFDVLQDNESKSEYTTGVPIYIAYGRKPNEIAEFFGYVWHTEPHFDFNVALNRRKTTVYCLGASSVMKDPLAATFTNQTASSIVAQVVAPYRFATDLVNSTFVWPTINCPGLTVWQFLRNLADREGWTYFCHNTDLKFFPRYTLLSRPSTIIPTFVTKYFSTPQTLFHFMPVSGEATGDPGRVKATRVAFGVDPRSGQSVAAQSQAQSISLGRHAPPPLFQKLESGLVSQNAGQVQQRVNAEDERNRFYVKAKATVNGDPRVTQGGVVLLEGLSQKDSGYWYVHKVVHHVKFNVYSMDLELGRDSTFDRGIRIPAQRGSVQPRLDPYGSVVTKTPSTILVNNTWLSTWIPQTQAVFA